MCCRAQPCSFNCHCYNFSGFPACAIGSFASAKMRSEWLCMVLTTKWEKGGSFKAGVKKMCKSLLCFSDHLWKHFTSPCSASFSLLLFAHNRNGNLSVIYSICGASVLGSTFSCGFGAGKQWVMGHCGIFFYPWLPVNICKNSNLSELCKSWVIMAVIPGLRYEGHRG